MYIYTQFINWPFLIAETENLLRGANWIYKYNSGWWPWLRPLVAGFSKWSQVFDPRPAHVRFMVKKKWHRHRVFSEYFGFPYQFHCQNAPYSPSYTCCSYQKEQWTKPGTLPKSSVLLEIRKHEIENNFHFLVFKLFNIISTSVIRFPRWWWPAEGILTNFGGQYYLHTQKFNHLKDDKGVSHVENFLRTGIIFAQRSRSQTAYH